MSRTHALLFNQYHSYTNFWITVNNLLNKDYDQKIKTFLRKNVRAVS